MCTKHTNVYTNECFKADQIGHFCFTVLKFLCLVCITPVLSKTKMVTKFGKINCCPGFGIPPYQYRHYGIAFIGFQYVSIKLYN